jgi:3-isopropylmalate/(R)-2-methylmalate dehydratase large subunit
MIRKTLFAKVWEKHLVRSLPSGQDQLLASAHLIHEVTSPQAFQILRDRNLTVRFPQRTFATVDHIIPTHDTSRPLQDPMAELMLQHLERNARDFGITMFPPGSGKQGIVHVVGPELGITQPGMVLVCGDSHTSTHGAFGSIALGLGTDQVANVLATGGFLLKRPKVYRIESNGMLPRGTTAKDLILRIIRDRGADGGIGYAYEYCGSTFSGLSMEARMTACNMSIEGGARCGYVNPDQTTFDYLRGRAYVPAGEAFDERVAYWSSFATDEDAEFDGHYSLNAATLQPMMTWGTNASHACGVAEPIPDNADPESLAYMQLERGKPLLGQKVNVAFIGSCTNGRLSDFRAAAKLITDNRLRVADGVKAIAVPGSELVDQQARSEGLDRIFTEAGWEWRSAGCSMCLAMNPDKLVGDQLCASSSNRNFKGRQGSPTGRTVLMSPASVAACAAFGVIADIRTLN